MTNHNMVEKLAQVRAGHGVIDVRGKAIGHVIYVRQNQNEQAKEAADSAGHEEEWLDLIADIAEPDDARSMDLVQQIWDVGFAKIHGPGLDGLSAYILPQQIAAVDEHNLYLNIEAPVV